MNEGLTTYLCRSSDGHLGYWIKLNLIPEKYWANFTTAYRATVPALRAGLTYDELVHTGQGLRPSFSNIESDYWGWVPAWCLEIATENEFGKVSP
jgi:hypothetical protein